MGFLISSSTRTALFTIFVTILYNSNSFISISEISNPVSQLTVIPLLIAFLRITFIRDVSSSVFFPHIISSLPLIISFRIIPTCSL